MRALALLFALAACTPALVTRIEDTKPAHPGVFTYYCDAGWTLVKPKTMSGLPACVKETE